MDDTNGRMNEDEGRQEPRRSDQLPPSGVPLDSPRFSDFFSVSPVMRDLTQMVRRVIPSDASLLILGETGVGKERLARAVHAEGPRAGGPFIPVNCGALPEGLLESELFGHEEGAFTGAHRQRRGMFELAHGGSIFLDEVGEMPYHLQVKLLRALQEHEIQRVGGEQLIEVDVRVMAASNRDLEAETEANRFRRDLYYRLSVVTLTLPPLRERPEDIPGLVARYLRHFRPEVGRDVHRLTPEAMAAMTAYAWPGNVRELMNVIERLMLLSGGEEVSLEDLPESIRAADKAALPAVPFRQGPSDDPLPERWMGKPLRQVCAEAREQIERRYLSGLLRRTGGRVGETASLAGLDPRSLYNKMKKYGLRKEDFRPQEGGRP